VDLRLGNRFVVCTRTRLPSLDTADYDRINSRVKLYHEDVYLRYGQSFVLHPNDLVLGSTLEYIRLPSDLSASIKTRSTWGRLGLAILTNPHITPGFRGSPTLELRNIGSMPIVLYPCLRIAHLVLERVSAIPADELDKSKYELNVGPQIALLDDEDLPLLRRPRRRVIIGVTGGMGSYTQSVADDLVKHYGFISFSLSHIVRQETASRGRPTTGANLRRTGNSLRKMFGSGVLVDRILRRVEREVDSKFIVLEGIRNPGEVESLMRYPNAFLIGLEAGDEERYQRLENVRDWSDWGGQDPGIETFRRLDAQDMGADEPPHGQQIGACLAEAKRLSDAEDAAFHLDTTGMKLARLHTEIERILREIERKIGDRIVAH